ncbi:hypothetical protein IV203_024186 [Nitzschia inconspicua]|uniref:Uncharacterized protein n=1 Tax=Nitzschia inconspicua TaxID=303405 RepID=A0A9K3KBV1_9STRA|nr:hypothetical protein IV203_024186 [Nitzschia inconspicua]
MHAMLFVDDPVRGNPLRPTADAIRALDGEEWLSTILIDHLLQTTLKGRVPDQVLIRSSDCYSYFSAYNDKLDIRRSRGSSRAFACISHANCSFWVAFGPKARQEGIILKRGNCNLRHSGAAREGW